VSKEKAEQTLLPGVVTEQEVFRSMMRKIGAKGGRARTAKKQDASRRNLQKALEARRAKRGKGSGGND